MTIESNDALQERLTSLEPETSAEDKFFDVINASTIRVFTKRPDVFSKPRLEISNAELSSKVDELAGRVSCTMDNFLHVARSVCGINLTSCIVTRVLFHLVDRRGHLLLSVRPRSAYFLGEATADLEAYLQKDPLFSPHHQGEVGDFVDSVRCSFSGKRSLVCQQWRQRKRTASRQNESSSGAEVSPPPPEYNPPSYSVASPIATSDHSIRFPAL